MKAEPETPKILGTTVDGIPHYKFDSGLGAFDIDGDGKYDFTDSAVGPNDAAIDGNIANAIRYNFGIPTTSKLHQDYPNIEEFRTRRWDLDGDGKFKEKIEILINGEVVHTTITDTNQDGSADLGDAVTELGWW